MSSLISPTCCISNLFLVVIFLVFIFCLISRPPVRSISMLPPPGLGVPRLPPGRKPPGPPPGPPPPQVLQMYGRKVGFALDVAPRRREEDVSYGSEPGKDFPVSFWVLDLFVLL